MPRLTRIKLIMRKRTSYKDTPTPQFRIDGFIKAMEIMLGQREIA